MNYGARGVKPSPVFRSSVFITTVTAPSPRPRFDSYALPLERRREGSATAVSAVAHITIALLVLWRGAVLFETGGGGGTGPRGGGGGGGRPAVSWVALPMPAAAQQEPAQPTPPPPPAVTVPTVATPVTEPVKLDVPPPTLTLRADAAGTGAGTTGGPGQGPGSGGGTGTGAGTGAGPDTGPGSGGAANDIFGPTPLLVPTVPSGAPPDDKRKHEVRFWIRADGTVTRVEVNPPIRDSGYRRRFMEAMQGFRFGPAKTREGRPIDYIYSIVVYP